MIENGYRRSEGALIVPIGRSTMFQGANKLQIFASIGIDFPLELMSSLGDQSDGKNRCIGK